MDLRFDPEHLDLLGRLAVSVLLVAGLYLLRRATTRWYVAHVEQEDRQYLARRALGWLFSVLGVLVLAWIWFPFFGDVATFVGIIGAGIAVALRDLFINLAGWIYIVSQRPFAVGDRVEIAGHAGDVVDVRGLRFTLREIGNWIDADQPTGRLVHVPNALVFSHTMANYTRDVPFVWHEVELLVTFESDWRAAEELVRAALERRAVPADRVVEATRTAGDRLGFPVDYSPETTATFVTTKESGVAVVGRLLVEARHRRAAHDAVWRDILDAVAADPTVELAYPTVRNVVKDPITVERPGR